MSQELHRLLTVVRIVVQYRARPAEDTAAPARDDPNSLTSGLPPNWSGTMVAPAPG
mgnify:CR=1 FL=1